MSVLASTPRGEPRHAAGLVSPTDFSKTLHTTHAPTVGRSIPLTSMIGLSLAESAHTRKSSAFTRDAWRVGGPWRDTSLDAATREERSKRLMIKQMLDAAHNRQRAFDRRVALRMQLERQAERRRLRLSRLPTTAPPTPGLPELLSREPPSILSARRESRRQQRISRWGRLASTLQAQYEVRATQLGLKSMDLLRRHSAEAWMSATRIQATIRGRQVRLRIAAEKAARVHLAARRLQRAWRGYVQSLPAMREAVIMEIETYADYYERVRDAMRASSATIIACAWRRCAVSHRVKHRQNLRQIRRRAAIYIQRAQRMTTMRKRARRLRGRVSKGMHGNTAKIADAHATFFITALCASTNTGEPRVTNPVDSSEDSAVTARDADEIRLLAARVYGEGPSRVLPEDGEESAAEAAPSPSSPRKRGPPGYTALTTARRRSLEQVQALVAARWHEEEQEQERQRPFTGRPSLPSTSPSPGASSRRRSFALASCTASPSPGASASPGGSLRHGRPGRQPFSTHTRSSSGTAFEDAQSGRSPSSATPRWSIPSTPPPAEAQKCASHAPAARSSPKAGGSRRSHEASAPKVQNTPTTSMPRAKNAPPSRKPSRQGRRSPGRKSPEVSPKKRMSIVASATGEQRKGEAQDEYDNDFEPDDEPSMDFEKLTPYPPQDPSSGTLARRPGRPRLLRSSTPQ